MKTNAATTGSLSSSTSSLETSSVASNTDDKGPKLTLKKSQKDEPQSEDQWCGVTKRPTRQIGDTHFFLSRLGKAEEPAEHEQRINKRGYDMDNPEDAIKKYETLHPESKAGKVWNWLCDGLFNACTLFAPKALSLSAGKEKQRIDQKVVLSIVRESVDKFPELKIRMSQEAFDLMDHRDQMRWHKKLAIIRAAQHDFIVQKLAEAYPNHIQQDAPTILYTGGRATGLLRVLYCSVDEYVALYWSDWGLKSTDSGSYKAHVYDYITEGNNVNWNARYLEHRPRDYEITEPGEYTFLGRGDRKIWSFEGPCGMVDHGIGDVISMAKFALVSNFSSTLNFQAVKSLLSTQATAIAHEYAQRLKDTMGYTEITVTTPSRVSEAELEKARNYFAPILERT